MMEGSGSVSLTNGCRYREAQTKTYGSSGSGTLITINIIINYKEEQNNGISYYVCFMMEESGSGSVTLTTDSDPDPGGQTHPPDPEH